MKKLLVISCLMLAMLAGHAQNRPVPRSGNYIGGGGVATSYPDPAPVYDTVFINIKDRARRKKAKAINARYKASTPTDTTDRLASMTDDQRTRLITKALEEDDRFKNYRERTETKSIKGEDVTIKYIHIAEDNYEMQVDKRGDVRYFKNSKPITKITFDFETTRRLVDVLNTIRQVEKFGK